MAFICIRAELEQITHKRGFLGNLHGVPRQRTDWAYLALLCYHASVNPNNLFYEGRLKKLTVFLMTAWISILVLF